MESKICTYTEKNVRLQLVRVSIDPEPPVLEIRLNRKIIRIYSTGFATEAKLYFLHCVNKILHDRSLSDLTS